MAVDIPINSCVRPLHLVPILLYSILFPVHTVATDAASIFQHCGTVFGSELNIHTQSCNYICEQHCLNLTISLSSYCYDSNPDGQALTEEKAQAHRVFAG